MSGVRPTDVIISIGAAPCELRIREIRSIPDIRRLSPVRRPPRIDFYRDGTAASPIGAPPPCCAANYSLLARNRPTGTLFIQCVSTEIQILVEARLHGSCLVSRCSSASANLPTPRQVLGA